MSPPSAAPLRDAHRELLRTARRASRSAEEAEDLVQDALEAALARGFEDWALPARRAWLRGVVQKRAAFLARGHARRRRRERLAARSDGEPARFGWLPGFLAALPPSLRQVAALASADLTSAEVRWILGLTDTALRQRLSVLRRAVRAAPESPTVPADPPFALGRRRAHMLAALKARPGALLAFHDPDGHALLLGRVAHRPGGTGNPTSKE